MAIVGVHEPSLSLPRRDSAMSRSAHSLYSSGVASDAPPNLCSAHGTLAFVGSLGTGSLTLGTTAMRASPPRANRAGGVGTDSVGLAATAMRASPPCANRAGGVSHADERAPARKSMAPAEGRPRVLRAGEAGGMTLSSTSLEARV